jgi:hypothetical protein
MDSFARDIFRALEEVRPAQRTPTPERRPPRVQSTEPEVVTLQPNDRFFVVRPGGLELPAVIPVPTGNRRAAYQEFADRYGINLGAPSSWVIRSALERFARALGEQGYEVEGNNYVRNRPLRLILEGGSTAVPPSNRGGRTSPTGGAVQTTELPDQIPLSTFRTLGSMTDFVRAHGLFGSVDTRRNREVVYQELNAYLIRRGYVYDRAVEALVRTGAQGAGPQLQGYQTLSDSLPDEVIVREVQNQTPVIITPAVLQTFAITEEELRQRLGGEWGNLETLLGNVESRLQVEREPALFILVASILDRLNTGTIADIHRAIGAQEANRVAAQLNDIRTMLRRRITTQPRSFVQRTVYPSDQVGSRGLQEALIEGYDILNNVRLMTEFAGLLELGISNRFVQYGVQLLRAYPEMAVEFFRMVVRPRNVVSLATVRLMYQASPGPPGAALNAQNNQSTNRLEEIYAYLVGFVLIVPEDAVTAQRRVQLNGLTPPYITVLRNMYGTRNVDQVLEMEPNILEPYLFALRGSKPAQIPSLMLRIGMLIPQGTDPRRYALGNLTRYEQVLRRPVNVPPINELLRNPPVTINRFSEQAGIYTDQELLGASGYVGPYVNRADLLLHVFTLITEIEFFLLNRIDPTRVTNDQTTLLERFDELAPPYLGFGRALQYRIYSLDEVNTAFHVNDNGEIEFPRPENPREAFTSEELGSFQEVLLQFRERDPTQRTLVLEIEAKIARGILMRTSQDRNTTNVRRALREASQEVRDVVKTIFTNLFYAGMYMRRWRGPGHPYPFQERETLVSLDPQPMAILTLGHVSEGLEQLRNLPGGVNIADLLETLRTVQIQRGQTYTYTGRNLFEYAGIIASGRECIRIGSLYMVTSGYYYLLTFFGEAVPGVDPANLDPIQ